MRVTLQLQAGRSYHVRQPRYRCDLILQAQTQKLRLPLQHSSLSVCCSFLLTGCTQRLQSSSFFSCVFLSLRRKEVIAKTELLWSLWVGIDPRTRLRQKLQPGSSWARPASTRKLWAGTTAWGARSSPHAGGTGFLEALLRSAAFLKAPQCDTKFSRWFLMDLTGS